MRRKTKRFVIGMALAIAGALFFIFGQSTEEVRGIGLGRVSRDAPSAVSQHGHALANNERGRPTQKTSSSRQANVDQLDRIVLPGTNPYQLHGHLGIRSDGTPGFLLKEAPPAESAMQQLAGHGFNARLSDSISLDRNITDYRDDACKNVRRCGTMWEEDLLRRPRTHAQICFQALMFIYSLAK